MRLSDISADRKPYLVVCEDRPNIRALLAPPTPRRLSLDPASTSALVEAEKAIATLQGYLSHSGLGDALSQALQQREAVQSSQIEGTHATLSDLLTYEATSGTSGLPADVQETGRYVQALQAGLAAVQVEGRGALSETLLHQLHAVLMQDKAAPFQAGRYRTRQVWIGGLRIEDATLVPAPPSAILPLMDEFIASMLQYARHEEEQFSLAITAQLVIAHAQFETIHPYEDGNGRVGRLLLPLILAAEQLPPLYLSGTLLRNRQHYYDCLAEVQLRSKWGPWTTLLSRAIQEACVDAIELSRDIATILADWHRRLAGLRSDATAHRLPALLVAHPIVSVKQVASLLQISQPSANAALNQLVTLGILQLPADERRWGRVFHAGEVLVRLLQPPHSLRR